jgi:SPP1 family predicted phage head-tail adaptor
MFRDVIELLEINEGVDADGFPTETITRKQIFANKKSIRQSEFYLARTQGLNLTNAFEIRAIDYNNEKRLIYNNVDYNIVRTYSKNGEILELSCSDRLMG